ncbi:MAG: hypothetical protein ACR2JC_03850 [Chloroflexota bacterium]|nr:MAG: hypothetical protein DLM70_08870 [Chloroflexota bacterium]
MNGQYISESTFLLIELRYTAGQLRVQIDNVRAELPSASPNEDEAGRVLARMIEDEGKYQAQYVRILGRQCPNQHRGEDEDPFAVFAGRRAQTLDMLEAVPEPWHDDLLALVRRHVSQDRRQATEIADQRRSEFDQGESAESVSTH